MFQRYNIEAFAWHANLNCFVCDQEPIPGIHPIGKKQFSIVNESTGGMRRFRYVKTIFINDWFYNYFVSEDGIDCIIREIDTDKNLKY